MFLNLQRGCRALKRRICGRTATVSITRGAFVLAVAYAAVTHATDDSRLTADAASIIARLDPRVAASLAHISGLERRLLALRSYLRAGDTLPARWSWSESEIRAYEASQEYRDAQAELDRVVEAFAVAYPGYTLYVNRQVRSLDVQIERWNTNRSVEEAGRALLIELRQAYPDAPADSGGEWLLRQACELDTGRAGDARRARALGARSVAGFRFPGRPRRVAGGRHRGRARRAGLGRGGLDRAA